MRLCDFEVGPERPFFLIAGPCVIEGEGLALETAGVLKEIIASMANINPALFLLTASCRTPSGGLSGAPAPS